MADLDDWGDMVVVWLLFGNVTVSAWLGSGNNCANTVQDSPEQLLHSLGLVVVWLQNSLWYG